MDNDRSIESAAPVQVALMIFVSLWGILAYHAVLGVADAGALLAALQP
jgi:hypothetical protein